MLFFSVDKFLLMPWIAINSKEGISEAFRKLPPLDQSRMIPRGSLPINILDLKEVENFLNESEEICRFLKGEKEVTLIEGYFPPKLGIWSTHKVLRINFMMEDRRRFVIAKVMPERAGRKEMNLLRKLQRVVNSPRPYTFQFDEELMKEGFSRVQGILWMRFVRHLSNIEEMLVDWCFGNIDHIHLENFFRLMHRMWGMGIMHNDLKGEHVLFDGQNWYVIDLDKAEEFRGENSRRVDATVLIGDSTIYLDKYIRFYSLKPDEGFMKRYRMFVEYLMEGFEVDSLKKNLMEHQLRVIKNPKIKEVLQNIEVS